MALTDSTHKVASSVSGTNFRTYVDGTPVAWQGVVPCDADGVPISSAGQGVRIVDGANLDAFSRLRVSTPTSVFDCQFTYDLQPLLFEPITSGAGATVTHSSTNRLAVLTAPTGAAGHARMQSYAWHRYQPGKGLLAFLTFNFNSATADVTKKIGLNDGNNGPLLELAGDGSVTLRLLSDTGVGDQAAAQADWNLDTMDGNGASGITLAWDKVQILVIDLQALYVGRVRIGFDVGGVIVYAHEFNHANIETEPYVQTASLPIRAEAVATAGATSTMNFVCCAVISEGGQESTAGYSFSREHTVTAASGSRKYVLSVQPKTTINSIANRQTFVLDSVDVLVTGSNPVLVELCVGHALTTPTWTDVNGTYSGTQYDTAGTLSGSPAIVFQSMYCAGTAANKSSVERQVSVRYPITLDAAGSARDLGRITVLATGLGGTSAMRVALNWREVR